ncbi:MAG: hypothetical protein ORO03_10245 [Alphaproteobacteria bacterium]|nr:hypothetical protein [Alphaproteobacteria bacterium]
MSKPETPQVTAVNSNRSAINDAIAQQGRELANAAQKNQSLSNVDVDARGAQKRYVVDPITGRTTVQSGLTGQTAENQDALDAARTARLKEITGFSDNDARQGAIAARMKEIGIGIEPRRQNAELKQDLLLQAAGVGKTSQAGQEAKSALQGQFDQQNAANAAQAVNAGNADAAAQKQALYDQAGQLGATRGTTVANELAGTDTGAAYNQGVNQITNPILQAELGDQSAQNAAAQTNAQLKAESNKDDYTFNKFFGDALSLGGSLGGAALGAGVKK